MSSAEPRSTSAAQRRGTLPAGTRLGKYEIIKRIAVGGMAELFLAKTVGLMSITKVVVIKRILPDLAQQTEFVEMFIDEARIFATLQHANVAQLHDVGMEEGNYFIAMEYLHGQDARALVATALRQGNRLPLAVALHIVTSVCAGLHYAHEKRGLDGKPLEIVHRDITPQNVVITYDGQVKLVDFGIAKANNRIGQTRAGTLKGKVSYMAPEQCLGKPVDRRCDLFTLGILLYELTLSRRLFRGTTEFDIFKQIVELPLPTPSDFDSSYPKELERIVAKALSRHPEQRYQTALEMQLDLEAFIRDKQVAASSTTTSAFISKTFDSQLDAWREASTKGKPMVKILEEQTPEVNLDLDDDPIYTAQTQVELTPPAMDLPTETKRRPPPPIDSTMPVDRVPRRSLGLMIGLPLLALLFPLGVYLAKRPRAVSSTPIAAPAPVAAAPAPSPIVITPLPATPPPATTPMPSPTPSTRAVAAPPADGKPAPPLVTKSKPKRKRVTNFGRLVLGSKPWVNVVIDGKRYGRSPVVANLAPGSHVVIVSNPSKSIRKSMMLTIEKGKTLRKLLAY